MEIRIVFEVNAYLKRYIYEYFLWAVDNEDAFGYPEPTIWVSNGKIGYRTASSKGEYIFDFTKRGHIVLLFTGYRNSFHDGTAAFDIDSTRDDHVVKEGEEVCLDIETLKTQLKVIGQVVYIRTSTPEKPITTRYRC